jgi:hypothetical protein
MPAMPKGPVVKHLALGLLLTAGANALAGKEPAWRFPVVAGQIVSSTVSVTNRCHAIHRLRASTTATAGFVRFRGPVDFASLPPGKIQNVDLDFTAEGLQPGVYRGDVVVACLDCQAEPRCNQSTELFGVEMTVAARQRSAGEEVVDSTLELFSQLASAEAERPQQLVPLLEARPEEARGLLRSLEFVPVGYDERIAKLAPVIPEFVFADRNGDLVSRARSLGLGADAAAAGPPSMIFRGKTLALLVIFQPKAAASAWPPALHPVAPVFMPGYEPHTLPVSESRSEVPYDAKPDPWTPGALIEHTWCGDLTSMRQLVTKLTYRGGGTDTAFKNLPDPLAQDCKDGKSIKLSQRPRSQPAPPVIIASGFLVRRNDQWTTVFSVPVTVPK